MRAARRLMRELGRSLCACAMATATCACFALAMHGCGILAPSDCAQKANCPKEGGDEPAVAVVPDDNESGDATQEVGPERDASSEPALVDADADVRDVVTEDVATEPQPVSDGSCNPPFTCAPPVPAGWIGPALFWTGDGSSPAPACPMNYQSQDLGKDLTGTEAGSCSCTCGLKDNCTANVTFYPDQACGTAMCSVPGGGMDRIQLTVSATSGCVAIPSNNCGSNATGGSVLTTNMTAYTASCDPTITPTIPTAAWNNTARLCSTSCRGSTEPCVIGPTPGFLMSLCIFQTGDVACPATIYVKKTLFYAGLMDTRTCGDCTCNGYDGGSCAYLGGSRGDASSLSVYGASGCSTSAGMWLDTTLDLCSLYNGVNSTLSSDPASLSYDPNIQHATCSGVSSMPQPTGGVAPTGPTTVCCQ
jgi:hypothetical protein